MKIFSPVLKGTTTSDGTSNLSGSFTGSLSGTAATASYVVSSVTDATQNTRLQTLESVTGSYTSTSSLSTSNSRISVLENVTGSYATTSSLSLTSASVAAINVRTGSYATTGSNYFIGNQVITGSVYIANDLVVQGSSSLQNITASAVSIGTNTVILNTNTPILQFGGISVYDSGSTQGRSGSLLWNSLADHWINVNPSGSDEGYNSAMVINGPKNTGSLGNETGLTTNYIPVSQGEDHITDSIIYQNGTSIGIGTTSPSSLYTLTLNGNASTVLGGISFKQSGTDTFYIGNPDVPNTTDFEFWNPRNGYLRFATNNIERIRINSSGNVGIGTTNPSFQLDLGGGTTVNTRLRLQRGSDDTNQYGVYGWNVINLYRANVALSSAQTDFSINQVGSDSSRTAFYISSTSNIGIGTTSPLSKLDISTSATEALCIGNASGTITSGDLIGALSFVSRDGSTYSSGGVANIRSYATQTYNTGNVAADLRFYVSNGLQNTTAAAIFGTEAMRITNEGNVGIGVTSTGDKLEVFSGASRAVQKFSTSTNGCYTTYASNAGAAGYIGNGQGILSSAIESDFAIRSEAALLFAAGANTERMRITSDGNIGIGTTSPVSSTGHTGLSINGSSISRLDFIVAGTRKGLIYSYGSGFSITSQGANPLILGTNDTENARITSGGNLGVGITDPQQKIQSSGRIRVSPDNSNGGDMAVNDGGLAFSSIGASPIEFFTSNYASERMRITSGGQVLIGQTTASGNSNGIYFRPGIESGFIVTSDVALQLSRLSTTGDIQTFYSGTTRVGKIAVGSSTVTFESSTNGGLTVNSSGNVGVGTSSPTHNLHVNSSLRVNRTVYSWYKASWQGNGTYWHMKTNLYAGAAGNTQYTMSFFKAFMYSYSSAAVYEGSYGFHNWNGILYSAASAGNISFGAYISTDGYVVLVVTSGSGETGVTIDWHQTYADYPFINSSVTAAGLHGSTTGKY